MRVLVTGSSGFIGQHVRRALEADAHTVIPFDRPLDIRHPAELARYCENADAVINLAGVLGTPELLGQEAAVAEVNVIGACNVYDAAKRRGIPVVQIGTGHKGQPNTYAITKACAEDLGLARAYWLGDKITVVRAFHVYGPGQLPGPPHGPATVHKFFPTFACRALRGEPLELHGSGGQLIDPIHVSLVARLLARVAVEGHWHGKVVEAGMGVPIAVRDIAAQIAELAGQGSKLTDVPPRMGEPEWSRVVADDRPLGGAYYWPYALVETLDWYRGWLAKNPA